MKPLYLTLVLALPMAAWGQAQPVGKLYTPGPFDSLSFSGAAQVSFRQAITPERMQDSMNATMRFIVWGTMPIGSILGGALGTVIGLHTTIVIGAVGGLFAFLPVTLSSARHIVRMPEPVSDDAAAGVAEGTGPG